MLKVNLKDDEIVIEFFQIYQSIGSIYKERFQKLHDELNENIPQEYSEFKLIFVELNDSILKTIFKYIDIRLFVGTDTRMYYNHPIENKSQTELLQMFVIYPKLKEIYMTQNELINKDVLELTQKEPKSYLCRAANSAINMNIPTRFHFEFDWKGWIKQHEPKV